MSSISSLHKLLKRSGKSGSDLLDSIKAAGPGALDDSQKKVALDAMESMIKNTAAGSAKIQKEISDSLYGKKAGSGYSIEFIPTYSNNEKRLALLGSLGILSAGAAGYGISELMND